MRLGARILASVLLLSMYLPVAVVFAATDALDVTMSASEVAGVADTTLTVTAKDTGSVDPSYLGTVHFTSDDPQAVLPADFTFGASDNGTATFSVTLKTAGLDTVTATDTVTSSIAGNASSTVSAGPAATVLMSGTTTNLASGSARLATATVKDAFSNPVVGQSVVFTEAGGGGSVSGLTPDTTDSSGVATDNVTGLVAGAVVITGTAGSASGTLSFSVVQGTVTSISVAPSSSSIAPGGSQSYATTSSDAAGNTAVVTGTAVLSISPNGSCSTTSCTATIGGAHTVTSTFSGHMDTSTLTVGNNPPTAVTDARTVLENDPSTLFNVLTNDTDPDGDTLTVTGVSDPPHGTATFAAANVHYQPDANYSGADSFTYSISDGNGGIDTGTVNVTITGVNQTPSFTKGANQSVSENAGAQSVPGWVVAKSPGPGNFDVGQTLNFIISNNNNSLFSAQPVVSAAGTLTYTPGTNKSGSATVTISIHDDGGTSNGGSDTSATQTFTITVNGVNQAPTFNGGADDTALEDSGGQTVSGWATSITDGPGDTGQTLNFIVTNSNNLLFSVQPAISPSGTLTYTPAANANGTTIVSVSLHDNGGTAGGGQDTSPIQTMNITVTAVNDAPTWNKGADQSVLENSGLTTVPNWASSFIKGPANESGQTLSINTTNNNNSLFSSQPVVSLAGTLAFTPALNKVGSATVTVTLSDDGGTANGGVDSAAKTFLITVTGVNQVPTFTGGGNDITNEDSGGQGISGWATGMDPGAANESGQNLNFIVTNSNNVLFSVQPAVSASTGNLTYTPAANANGVATVTVKLHDDGGTASGGMDTSAGQTMTITVTAVNDAPTFSDPSDQTINEDAGAQVVVGLAAPTSRGPADEAAQTLTFLVTNDNNALFSVQPTLNTATGTLSYTPVANANGSALVTAKLSDNGGMLNGGADNTTHQFNITINSVNDAPTFVKGANISLPEESSPSGHTVSGWATGFDPGPANESGQTLTNYTVTNDRNTLFSVQPDVTNSGTLTYTLAANRNGVATVSVSVTDSGGTSNGGVNTSAIQTFTITVVGVDHPPAAINDFPTVVQGSGPVKVDVLLNDIDPDGDPLTIAGIRQGTNGRVALSADHKFLTYDPNGSFIGTDSFIYSVSDGRGQLAFGTVLVTVVKDTIGPVTTTPTAWLMALPVGATATIAVTWNGSDQGFGVKYYQAQESKNNTPWQWVPVTVGAKFIHRVVTIGSLYQYRVRGVDQVGNPGAWVYLGNFRPTLFQETSATFIGTWAHHVLGGSLGGSVSYASTHGSVASFTCTCSSLLWIGPRSSGRSTSRVYIDGVLVGVINEYGTTTLNAQGLYSRTWGVIGSHRIDISVTGAGRVDVDGFLTLQ